MTSKYQFKPVPNKVTPIKGQTYWSVNGNCVVIRRVWNDHEVDKQRLRHNNVFGSFKTAHAVRKSIEGALKKGQA